MPELCDDGRDVIFAVIPPLLLGLGSAFAILSNSLVGSIAAWVCIAIVIFAGGLITLTRDTPTWGDTWLGSFLILIALLLRLLMEERKEGSPPVFSSLASGAITVLVSLALLTLIIAIARKGWRRGGLVGIGLSTTLGIGIWNTFARLPFNQKDLALLVAPIGVAVAICTYLYVRKSDTARIFILLTIWLICLSTALISSHVYQEWFSDRGRAFPLIALMAILSILLWSGPFLAMTISAARKMPKFRLIKKNE
jgi:hypothetical protein